MSGFVQNSSQLKTLLALALLIVCIITASLYIRSLESGFHLDDLSNLGSLDNSSDHNYKIFLFNNLTKRPLSYLTFIPQAEDWINKKSFNIKAVNLSIHIINILLVYYICCFIFKQAVPTSNQAPYIFALLCTFFWAIAPIHISTILYAIQRMVLLASFFSFLAVAIYIYYSARISTTKQWITLAGLLTLIISLGMLSKEIAINTFWLIGLIILTQKDRPPIWWVTLTIIAPLTTAYFYILFIAEANFVNRDFTMMERLVTQQLIFFEYIYNIVLPFPKNLSLFQDDHSFISLANSKINLLLLAVWPLILALCAYLMKSFKQNKSIYFSCFGLLLFIFTHQLEGSTLSLELYFEHRNYLPSLGIFIILTIALSQIYLKSHIVFSAIIIALAGISLFTHITEVNSWRTPTTFALANYYEHPTSNRAVQSLTNTLLRAGEDKLAIKLLEEQNKVRYASVNDVTLLRLSCAIPGTKLEVTKEEIFNRLKSSAHDRYIGIGLNKLYATIGNETCPEVITKKEVYEINNILLANPNLKLKTKKELWMVRALELLEENRDEEALETLFLIITDTSNYYNILFAIELIYDRGGPDLAQKALEILDYKLSQNSKIKFIFNDDINRVRELVNSPISNMDEEI